MEGKIIDFDNNYNLYEYFSKISLNQSILNRKAIISNENTFLTFDQLNKNIIKLNNYIHTKLKNVIDTDSNNKIVGIHLTPDENTIQILLAIHSLGLCYLPIDPLLPTERMAYIINDSKCMCIITNVSNAENNLNYIIQNKNITLIHLDDFLKSENVQTDKALLLNSSSYDSKDNACVMYTSGSTGVPKGVRLSHYSIMNRLNWQWNKFEISEDNNDIGAFKTSLNFADHISEIFAFILKGLPICVIKPGKLLNPIELIETIHSFKITYFVLVPSLLKNIILTSISNGLSNKLSTVKRWVCSGEELSAQLLESFFDMNLPNSIISNFYGSTEVTADLTYISFESKEQTVSLLHQGQSVPIGVPVANSSFYILDESMNQVEQGNIGEIYAYGECLAKGYLNESLNTKFVNHNNMLLFKTGDFGFVKNDNLYFAGRKDSQLKIRGKRVDLNDLIFYSNKIEGIESFIPLIVEIKNNKIIIAYYKLNINIPELEMNVRIKEKLKLYVYDYMIPSHLFKLEKIPLLYNGKIDKQSLIRIFEENQAKESINTSKSNKVLETILNVTGLTFEAENDSTSSLTFEQLGINSLNAIEIYLELSKINKISFEKFLSLKTLDDLLEYFKPDIVENSSLGKSSSLDLEIIPLKENKDYTWKVMDMYLDTFMEKNVFFKHIIIDRETHFQLMKETGEFYGTTDESFIVFDKNKNEFVAGAYLNNCGTEPPVKTDHYMRHLFDFFDFFHQRLMQKVNLDNLKILYAFILTTNKNASMEENVMLIKFGEEKIVDVAKKFNYQAILTTNANVLTRVILINQTSIKFVFLSAAIY
jgi:acyl-coenzyme A synthetase/AMP-(fatty) acid ligase/acyl carrier protein